MTRRGRSFFTGYPRLEESVRRVVHPGMEDAPVSTFDTPDAWVRDDGSRFDLLKEHLQRTVVR